MRSRPFPLNKILALGMTTSIRGDVHILDGGSLPVVDEVDDSILLCAQGADTHHGEDDVHQRYEDETDDAYPLGRPEQLLLAAVRVGARRRRAAALLVDLVARSLIGARWHVWVVWRRLIIRIDCQGSVLHDAHD